MATSEVVAATSKTIASQTENSGIAGFVGNGVAASLDVGFCVFVGASTGVGVKVRVGARVVVGVGVGLGVGTGLGVLVGV